MRGGVKAWGWEPEECCWNPAGSRLLRGSLARGMAGKERVRKREVRQGGREERREGEGTELTRAKENILHLIDFVDRFK